ncbi:MAG: aminoacyl-tRNA hydrolase [Lentisphaeria bacterium]|nr:aminoacyl-tRNA hydrolase [Lentisphaeria bacterium]
MLLAGKIFVPDSELQWQFAQSGGPGGQNVNKVCTAVRLSWNLLESPSVPEPFRERLLARLGGRLNGAGELVVTAREERSQYLNRRSAAAKLDAMIAEALTVRKMRRATKPTKASVARRLESKGRRAEVKAMRRSIGTDE